MDFITINFEIADRYLPSYCSVAAVKWEKGTIKDMFFSYIYPDCDIEPFFNDRHKITNSMVENAPKLYDIWDKISDFICDSPVFFVHGSKEVDSLLYRLAVDNLICPNIEYYSLESLYRRTWGGAKEGFTLNNMVSALNLESTSYDALSDAMVMGKIIYKSFEENKVVNLYDLFEKIGFAGGFVVSGQKYIYRAVKDKSTQTYNFKLMLDVPELLSV